MASWDVRVRREMRWGKLQHITSDGTRGSGLPLENDKFLGRFSATVTMGRST